MVIPSISFRQQIYRSIFRSFTSSRGICRFSSCISGSNDDQTSSISNDHSVDESSSDRCSSVGNNDVIDSSSNIDINNINLSSLISSSDSQIKDPIYKRIVIHWFRLTDLRLTDNQALFHSSTLAAGDDANYGRCKVLPIFIFDSSIYGNDNITKKRYGLLKCSARRANFILECVQDLRQRLYERYESHLLVAYGKPLDIFADLLAKLNDPKNHIPDFNPETTSFYMDTNIVVQDEPAKEERIVVRSVQRLLREYNTETRRRTNEPVIPQVKRMHKIWGSTLYMPRNMPWDKSFNNVSNKVPGFTNRMVRMHKIEPLLPQPRYLEFPHDYVPFLSNLINYMPTLYDLGYNEEQIEQEVNTIDPRSQIKGIKGGETAGLRRIKYYMWQSDTMHRWNRMRSGHMINNDTSKFGLYLAHGCISPRTIAHETERYFKKKPRDNGDTFSKVALVKRDFCKYYAMKHSSLLFRRYIGPVPKKKGEMYNLKPTIKPRRFYIWMQGKTGYPLVDACMRELNATGYINDRSRMILASFLCHNLHFEWTHGAYYFQSKCIDYNVFCNWVNWALVCGNTDGSKFDKLYYNHEYKYYDPDGEYIRKWVEELKDLPKEFITEPWKMKEADEEKYNFKYGTDYPYRVVLPMVKTLPNRNSSDVQVIEEMIRRELPLKGIKNVEKTLLDYYHNQGLEPPVLPKLIYRKKGKRRGTSMNQRQQREDQDQDQDQPQYTTIHPQHDEQLQQQQQQQFE